MTKRNPIHQDIKAVGANDSKGGRNRKGMIGATVLTILMTKNKAIHHKIKAVGVNHSRDGRNRKGMGQL